MCEEFRQKHQAETFFRNIQNTSKIMTYDKKVTKEWHHKNQKNETRRIKAFFNSGANIGKALQKADAEKAKQDFSLGQSAINEDTQGESKEKSEIIDENQKKELSQLE